MTKIEYINYIDQIPALTTHGFGTDRNGHNYNHVEEHEDLKNFPEAFEICEHMLTNQYTVSTRKEDNFDSYRLKHEAERYAEDVLKKNIYVPEGVLVAVVLHLGLPYERSKETTGIFIRLKKK